MRQANLHINSSVYTLYNKGVDAVAYVCSLQRNEEKKDERKTAKYLVVPNICILSLSLSLSSKSGQLSFLVRAREGPRATIVNKGLP